MKNGHVCEHTPKGNGACDKCRFPMKSRGVKFVGSKKDWLLLYRGRILQRGKVLVDLLKMTKDFSKEAPRSPLDTYRNLMIMSPNGVRLSIAVARELGI